MKSGALVSSPNLYPPWCKTLTPRFIDFFTDFEKKKQVLQSLSFQMLFSIGNYFPIEYYVVIKHRQIEWKTGSFCEYRSTDYVIQ